MWSTSQCRNAQLDASTSSSSNRTRERCSSGCRYWVVNFCCKIFCKYNFKTYLLCSFSLKRINFDTEHRSAIFKPTVFSFFLWNFLNLFVCSSLVRSVIQLLHSCNWMLFWFAASVQIFNFWAAVTEHFVLQEPKTDKDEDICRKLNDFLNNPPAPGSSHGGGSSLASLPAELAGLGGYVTKDSVTLTV